MFEKILEILMSWQFYAILLALTLVAWTTVSTFFKRVNLSKGKVMLIAVLGIFLALGGSSMLGIGTVSDVAGVGSVVQLQTTTAYVFSGPVAAVADSGTDNTKRSDFYINVTQATGNGYIDTGVFKVRRLGALEPVSCEVRVLKPARYTISDTTYHIVDEVTATGIMYAYIHTGATSAVATSADPKEVNSLSFDRGVDSGFVAFNITIDETGFDVLTKYDIKDITTNICGYKYVFGVHKAD